MKFLPLLLLTPLLTLLLNCAIVIERNPFYSSWADPIYNYMFNGLNLASGELTVGEADHPGTPLHIYAGITLKFFHLFRNEKDIIKDVIADPEWYLFRIGIASSILISLCIFFAGWLMIRFTGNIFYALLIQVTHLISLRSIFFSQNLMTEFILVLTGILLAPLIVAFTFSETKKQQQKLIITAAILSGIMIAGKFSSFPLVFMWLIMSRNMKQVFTFLWITVLSFVAFTFPAWHLAVKFYDWIGGMVTHTGTYGHGSEGVVNWKDFFINLQTVVNDVWFFTFTFYVITIILTIHCINYSLKKKHFFFKNIKPLVGIWVSILLQTLIVCKHYSLHYMIPAHLLVIPAWIIMAEEFYRNRSMKKISNQYLLLRTIPVGLSVLLLIKAEQRYYFFPGLKQPDKILLEKIKPYKYDLILFDCNITAPFPQPALLYGVNYAGKINARYFSELEKKYTGFYFVKRDTGKLNGWKKEFNPKDVLKNNMDILYYSSNDKFNIDSLHWQDGGIRVDSVLFSFRDPGTKESIFIAKLKAGI